MTVAPPNPLHASTSFGPSPGRTARPTYFEDLTVAFLRTEPAFNGAVPHRRAVRGLGRAPRRDERVREGPPRAGARADRLTAIGAVCSMSSKGDCWDNAVAESFFGTLKTEPVHRKSWSSPAEARLGVAEYVHQFYNPVRLHSSIGYKSPIEAEIQYARGEAIEA
jgi:putative transposase